MKMLKPLNGFISKPPVMLMKSRFVLVYVPLCKYGIMDSSVKWPLGSTTDTVGRKRASEWKKPSLRPPSPNGVFWFE